MPELKAFEWMVILATFAGPIVAVQAQKWIERGRERRQQKQRLFYTLMGTRAARVSPEHVRALNGIDLEFYGRKVFGLIRWQFPSERAVINAWRIYQDHLNQPGGAAVPPEGIQVWVTRGDELFTELLYFISYSLGFDFDRVQLRRGIYNPRAHDENEVAGLAIRNGLVQLLSGRGSLKMEVTSFPVAEEDTQRHRNVQTALLRALEGDQPLKITVERGGDAVRG